MAGEELTLKAVLEAVLDARGFDEFKAKIEESAASAKQSGAAAEEGGGHFDKLGKRLPHAAFQILSQEMLRNVGVQQGLGPLTHVSTAALESLAAAGHLTTGALAGATLGISLLLPLIAALAMKSDETADASKRVQVDTDTLVETYEKLKAKTGHLTRAQEDYLKVLKELQAEERRAAEEGIEAQIRAQDKLISSTMSLWGATKLYFKETLDFYRGKRETLSLDERMLEITDKARKEQARLGAELENLRKAHELGYKSAEDQANAELEAAEKAKVAAEKAAEAAKKLADYRLNLSQGLETALAQLAVERAETTFDREKAIARQEGILLEQQLHAAIKLGATDRQMDQIRELSHLRTITRIRAEEKKYVTEREKQIADGIKKNHDEAAAKIADIEKVRALEKAAADEKKAQTQLYWDMAAASFQAASMIFGKNKSLAIASAIMDTLAAANKAMVGPPPVPWSLPFVALALATGYKNVQAIKSAGSEGGFDDPGNDALVNEAFRNVGRRWASDMVGLAKNSFAGGLGEAGRAGGSLIHQSTTKIDRGTHIQNLSFSGMMGTPNQAMLDFERRRIRIARVENRTRRRGGP